MSITRITRRNSRTKNKTVKIDRSGTVPFAGVVKTTVKKDGSIGPSTALPKAPEPTKVKVEAPIVAASKESDTSNTLVDEESTEESINQIKKRDGRKTRRRVN